jgi:hypothetical protein
VSLLGSAGDTAWRNLTQKNGAPVTTEQTVEFDTVILSALDARSSVDFPSAERAAEYGFKTACWMARRGVQITLGGRPFAPGELAPHQALRLVEDHSETPEDRVVTEQGQATVPTVTVGKTPSGYHQVCVHLTEDLHFVGPLCSDEDVAEWGAEQVRKALAPLSEVDQLRAENEQLRAMQARAREVYESKRKMYGGSVGLRYILGEESGS